MQTERRGAPPGPGALGRGGVLRDVLSDPVSFHKWFFQIGFLERFYATRISTRKTFDDEGDEGGGRNLV